MDKRTYDAVIFHFPSCLAANTLTEQMEFHHHQYVVREEINTHVQRRTISTYELGEHTSNIRQKEYSTEPMMSQRTK